MYYRQQSHCNPNGSSIHNSSCSRERTKASCNRYLKSIVQCTKNKQATNNSEFSSPVHLLLITTWNLSVKYPFFPYNFLKIYKTIKLKNPQIPPMGPVQTCNILFLLLETKLTQTLWILEEYPLVSINSFVPIPSLFLLSLAHVVPCSFDQLLILTSWHFLPSLLLSLQTVDFFFVTPNPPLHFDFTLLPCFQQPPSTLLPAFVRMPPPWTSTLNLSALSSPFLVISFLLACQDPECWMEECKVHRKDFLL